MKKIKILQKKVHEVSSLIINFVIRAACLVVFHYPP